MPTYEYLCRRCASIFEKKMTMDEKKTAKTTCPNCGSEDVRQQFFGVNFLGKKTGDRGASGGCCGGGGTGCCG
ncbi:MAG: zinc ribbon domain-containing protein [Candidatus Aminicenantes bacterium]|nr:zinc ribbon domain-containing protein [Candidatus Aminicenantes bacterium]